MRLGNLEFDEKLRSQTNTLILGPPGFGKSCLMEHMAREDLKYQRPFMFVDRHGSSYQRMKRRCAYTGEKNITFIDPSEGLWVKPTNFFARVQGVDISVQTSGMVEGTLSIWGDSNPNSYPVMFKILKVVYTIVVEKEMPLNEAFHLLGNRKALDSHVATLSDAYIKTVWEDLRKLPHFEWSRQVTPTINRLFRLVQSKAVQRFMCIPSKYFEYTFKDTVFVNLGTSGNLDNDAANMFLVLMVNALYQQSKRRKGENGKDPPPYYVYIDEWVVPSPDFSRILAECRKFGLLLCLASQDLSQVRTAFGSGFADTLLTLCQAQICFGGLNDADATRLSKEWEIEKEKVKELPERKCFVKLPRTKATVMTVPEVTRSYVTEKAVASHEKRMAKKVGALPVEQVDEQLKTSQNVDTPTPEDLDPYE